MRINTHDILRLFPWFEGLWYGCLRGMVEFNSVLIEFRSPKIIMEEKGHSKSRSGGWEILSFYYTVSGEKVFAVGNEITIAEHLGDCIPDLILCDESWEKYDPSHQLLSYFHRLCIYTLSKTE